MGTGMEMQMMALFIGGVPVQGGTGTKISFCLSPLIVLLENGLVLSGSSGPMTQLIKGLALLAIVYLSVRLNKVERLRSARSCRRLKFTRKGNSMAQFQSYNKILVCQEDGISNVFVNGQIGL